MKKPIWIIIVILPGLLLLGWLAQGCLDPAPGQLLSPEELENAPEYRSLEEALKKPEKVYKLNLSGKQLTTLPKSIGKLTNLQELNLYHNKLTTLPESITKCLRQNKVSIYVLGAM